MPTSSADLFAAIDGGDAAAVDAILASEPGLAAARDADDVSALMHALYRNQRPIAERVALGLPSLDVFEAAALDRAETLRSLLIAAPSAATAWSPDGFTALHFAAFFGGGDGARLLLEACADPDLRSRNDFAVMPLHSATAGARTDVVAALLQAKADPDVAQRHGYRPLHGAAENGDRRSVELLLAAGADRHVATDDGRTPADLARAAGHEEIAALLG